MSLPRPVQAPTGNKLTCKSWQTEAVYRMLQNNLDPRVAQRPLELVVYGGRGQAANVVPLPPDGTQFRFYWNTPVLISPHNSRTI